MEIYREVVLRATTPAWLTDGGELCLASAARVRSLRSTPPLKRTDICLYVVEFLDVTNGIS